MEHKTKTSSKPGDQRKTTRKRRAQRSSSKEQKKQPRSSSNNNKTHNHNAKRQAAQKKAATNSLDTNQELIEMHAEMELAGLPNSILAPHQKRENVPRVVAKQRSDKIKGLKYICKIGSAMALCFWIALYIIIYSSSLDIHKNIESTSTLDVSQEIKHPISKQRMVENESIIFISDNSSSKVNVSLKNNSIVASSMVNFTNKNDIVKDFKYRR